MKKKDKLLLLKIAVRNGDTKFGRKLAKMLRAQEEQAVLSDVHQSADLFEHALNSLYHVVQKDDPNYGKLESTVGNILNSITHLHTILQNVRV